MIFLLKPNPTQQKNAKVPYHGFLAYMLMAGSEPLLLEADPPIIEAQGVAQDGGKYGPIKKNMH